MVMILKDAVKHDRVVRRKMSRKQYAEAVGLTETRVHSLEFGRKIKPGELELMMQFVGDLMDSDLVAATVDEETSPVLREDPEQNRVDFERSDLGYAYLAVMRQLGSRVPPPFLAWPSQFRLETAPPIDFPAIRGWIDGVRAWLLQEDGEVGGQTAAGEVPQGAEDPSSDEAPAPDPTELTRVPFLPENLTEPTDPDLPWTDDSEEDDEWETVAEVGEDDAVMSPLQIFQPEPQFTSGGEIDAEAQLVLRPDVWYVTNGERTTFMECQRRWYLESYRTVGIPTRKVTGAAAVGTRFHAALATWYRPIPGDPWAIFDAGVAEDRAYLEDTGASEAKLKVFEGEVDLVRAMLEGYFQWIQEEGKDVGLQIVAPEAVLDVDPKFPAYPHVRLLAKLDVRVIDERDGSRLFVDHKSVGGFEDALRTLHLDEQMLHYHLIEYLTLVGQGLSHELRAAGALYNMARKVKRTAKAQPPFYLRERVPHNLDQLQSYWQRVLGSVDQMTMARARLDAGEDHRQVVPPHPTRDCSWKCEFFTLCPMMDDNRARSEDYISEQLVNVHPLARYQPEAVGETV